MHSLGRKKKTSGIETLNTALTNIVITLLKATLIFDKRNKTHQGVQNKTKDPTSNTNYNQLNKFLRYKNVSTKYFKIPSYSDCSIISLTFEN